MIVGTRPKNSFKSPTMRALTSRMPRKKFQQVSFCIIGFPGKMFFCHAYDTGAGILQETMLKILGKKKDLEHVNMEKGVKKAGLDNMLPIEVILVEMSIL